MTEAQDWVTLALGFIALVSAVAGGWFKWVSPKFRRASAEVTEIRDNILGRPAIKNEITGKVIAEAVPSLGTQIAGLGDAVRELTKSHKRLDDLEDRVEKLEEAAVERVVTRAESAAAFRAIEAAVQATPDEVVE
jgi:hypothetical protein